MNKDSGLLRCYTVLLDKWAPTLIHEPATLLDESKTFLLKVRDHLPSDAAQPRKARILKCHVMTGVNTNCKALWQIEVSYHTNPLQRRHLTLTLLTWKIR